MRGVARKGGPYRDSFIDTCQRDREELPRPDLPLIVGLDGGYVHSSQQRSRRDGWFEVIAGKAIPAHGPASCFGYVQTYDTKPKRRLYEVAAMHLQEASALAARMDTEVGTWAHLWFGPTTVGIRKPDIAVEVGEYGQALQAAETVHPELLPSAVMQVGFWVEVACAQVTDKKTREKGVRVLFARRATRPPADS